jgi:hypothetical protein
VSDHRQKLVAPLVAEGVVDLFEALEIDEEHRQDDVRVVPRFERLVESTPNRVRFAARSDRRSA